MKDVKKNIKLSEKSKNNIKQIEHSWKVEGYKLTQKDKEALQRIATKQSSAQEEVREILKKYQSGGGVKWDMTSLQTMKRQRFLI